MNDVISYKEGAGFADIEDNWEDKITQGEGTSYGLEVLFQKKQGRTTGWLGYTLSWNNRQFSDINNGKQYPYKFDRRHDVELTVSHKITKNINLSGTWVYGTGNAITLTEATYVNGYNTYYWDGNGDGTPEEYVDYDYTHISGEKNAFRMPAYHRLDLGVEFLKKKKHGERAWNISVYNVYNRKNPYFIFLGRDLQNDQKVYKQISLIPIIPSLSYRFKF
jgi:hypothetical protein